MLKVFLFLMCLSVCLAQTPQQLEAMPQAMRDYFELLQTRETQQPQTLAAQIASLPPEMQTLTANNLFVLETPESVEGILFAAQGDIGVMTKTVTPFLAELLFKLDKTKVRVRLLSETPYTLEGVENRTRSFFGTETLVFVNNDFMLVGGFLDENGPTAWVNQTTPGLESLGTFDLLWSDN
jgi:hypothetical protein